MRTGLRIRAMAVETERIAGLAHHGDVFAAMRVVARGARDAAGVHQALDEIVALHPVLVGGAVGKVGEGGFAQFMFFQLPIIGEILADVKAYRPIVIFAFDRVLERLALGMTLDAGVAGVNVIEARRIEDVIAKRLLAMRLARAMTSLATDIPLGHGLGLDVVVHRMAAVAERPRGALEIVGRVKRRPPIGAVGDEIPAPDLMRDVPLDRQREIIVADFLEVTLLPSAAVNEGDVVLGEAKDRIRL